MTKTLDQIIVEFRQKYVRGHGPISNGDNWPQDAEAWVEADIEDLEEFIWKSCKEYAESVKEKSKKRVYCIVCGIYIDIDTGERSTKTPRE